KDRLINAQNEPQNWLMMNGDYGSTRYSKLSQINRENVKSLHMTWALALGGMQDVGQNGPEAEVNPLIDNGFMYTSDGWGTIYKIDARNPGKGEFVWISDSGVRHEGNVPRSRGIALWAGRARCQDRQRALALVRRAEAGRARQRDLEGQDQRLEDRRRRALADRLLRPDVEADHLGHRQSSADLRPAGPARGQSLHQFSG